MSLFYIFYNYLCQLFATKDQNGPAEDVNTPKQPKKYVYLSLLKQEVEGHLSGTILSGGSYLFGYLVSLPGYVGLSFVDKKTTE